MGDGFVGARRSVGAFVAAIIVCGCGGPSSSDRAPVAAEPPSLRIAFSRSEGTTTDIDLVRRQIEPFVAAHPGLRVEVVAQKWRTTDVHDLWARYLALGDPSIDIYVIDDPWVAEFAFAGWIRPLDELRGWADQTLHPAALRTGVWRDQLYAVPVELSANGLFYRRDLLAKAGLPTPTTLEELLSASRQLQERDPTLNNGLLIHAQFLHNDVYPFLWASGGGPLRDGRIALDDPVNLEVIATLRAGIQDGALAADHALRAWRDKPYEEAVSEFKNGQAAFMVTWLREKVDLAPEQYGIAPIPGLAGRGGGAGATMGSWSWAVNAESHHPELASELIMFLSSEQTTAERFETLGAFPPLRMFYEDPAWLARQPSLAVAGPIFAGAEPRMPVPNEREVDEIIEDALRRTLIEGEDVPATLGLASTEAGATVDAFPDAPIHLPDQPEPERDGARERRQVVVIAAIALWVLAIGAFVVGVITARRRGGLFRRLATKLSVLGLSTLLLALTTGTAVALAVLVQNQEEAIRAAQSIFRASIREQSQSLGRQIALGASVVREVSTSAGASLVEGDEQSAAMVAKDQGVALPSGDTLRRNIEDLQRETLDKIERNYDDSLYVLAAEGAYNKDILFLQLIDDEGRIVAKETDFLERSQGTADNEHPQVEDPTVREVARFGRTMSMRDVPATADAPAHLEVMVPLVQNGRHGGAVRIAYSKQRQEERIAALRARQEQLLSGAVLLLTLATVGLVGLSTVLLLLFSRSVALPLVRLSQLASQVSAGDLTVHCDVRGRDEVASLAGRLNHMVDGLRERLVIRETLGRYLGPSVSDVILAGNIELGGEEREVTLLFSDVRGFSSMSEKMTPPEVVRVLNTYFEQMVEAVFVNDGMLDKFIGDGLMAIFGAPRDLGDHALCAVRCAVAMRERLIGVNQQLVASGLSPLTVGIGVHTGQVVVGNIGSSKRTEYTAIGDNVNLAARIEGLTKEHQADILISEATYLRVADHVRADRLGEVLVKGKERAVVIYAVRELRLPDRADHPPPSASPAIVGEA